MALINFQQKYIFIHIYKTGGNSLRTILDGKEVGMAHWPAKRLKDHCYKNGLQEIWDSSYKFGVVRHPYDWMVSLYYHLQRDKGHRHNQIAVTKTFPEFIVWMRDEAFQKIPIDAFWQYDSQSNFLGDDSGLLVDKVFKLEEYNQTAAFLKNKFNIKKEFITKNIGHNRPKGKRALDYFTPPLKQIVNKLFHQDFKNWGYSKQ